MCMRMYVSELVREFEFYLNEHVFGEGVKVVACVLLGVTLPSAAGSCPHTVVVKACGTTQESKMSRFFTWFTCIIAVRSKAGYAVHPRLHSSVS